MKSLLKQKELQQLQEHGPQGQRAASNAFVEVALPWAAALLRDCDHKRHGVDLFGRDPLLLGRLLITLVRTSS